jgi:type I restriction enzyme S subunit
MYNIGDGKLVWRDIKRMRLSKDEITEYRLLPGDLLVNRVNSRELVGKAAVIPEGAEPLIFESKNIRLRLAQNKANPKFINYQLLLNGRRHFSTNAQQVVGMASVNQKQLSDFPIVLPSLGIQEGTVTEIEKQFSRLDEAVASLKRTKANLKRYKAAVLKAAVEGKLTEDWRKQHPDVEPGSKLLERTLAERRTKLGHKQDGFLPADGDPPAEAPDGWTICSIDQITECLDAKRVPVNKTERTKRGGDIPYYGANGQVGEIDDYIFDEPLVLVVEDETFTGRTQAFSYLIQGKSWVNNHAHVLRATAAVNVRYLNYALAHYPFIARTTGSTGRRKLTQKGLMTAPFLLPSFAEQERIVAEVERRLSVIDELETAGEANLTRADRLRQSILRIAFCGKLVAGSEGSDVFIEVSE